MPINFGLSVKVRALPHPWDLELVEKVLAGKFVTNTVSVSETNKSGQLHTFCWNRWARVLCFHRRLPPPTTHINLEIDSKPRHLSEVALLAFQVHVI